MSLISQSSGTGCVGRLTLAGSAGQNSLDLVKLLQKLLSGKKSQMLPSKLFLTNIQYRDTERKHEA